MVGWEKKFTKQNVIFNTETQFIWFWRGP